MDAPGAEPPEGTDAAGGGAGDGGAPLEGAVIVRVRLSNEFNIKVKMPLDATVGEFKGLVARSCGVPEDQQRMIYKGRILKDDQTLDSYGVKTDHTIHLVRRVASTAPSSTSAANVGVSRASGALGSLNLLDLSTSGIGEKTVSGQMQQQLTQNPTITRDIIDLPAIQTIMSNPELILLFLLNNPQTREIIDRDLETHGLNVPNALLEFEVECTLSLIIRTARNTDGGISNIESSPVFNMLNRMRETVQEPVLNATASGGDLESDTRSNPFAAHLRNQGDAQARASSSNSSTTISEVASCPAAPNADPLPNPWSINSGGRQPVNTRSNPSIDAQAPGIAGLGVLRLPDQSQTTGQVLDPSLSSQLLQDPDVNQRQRAQSLFPLLSQQQSRGDNNQTEPSRKNTLSGAGTGTLSNTALESLTNMSDGLGTGGFQAPNPSNVPPEELYATQLSQLQEMGFFDTQENIRALTLTAGNVHAAVELLLRNPSQ